MPTAVFGPKLASRCEADLLSGPDQSVRVAPKRVKVCCESLHPLFRGCKGRCYGGSLMTSNSQTWIGLFFAVSLAAACGGDDGGNGSGDGSGNNGGTVGTQEVCETLCDKQVECGADSAGRDTCVATCNGTIFSSDDGSQACSDASRTARDCFAAAGCDAVQDGSACEDELGSAVAACLGGGGDDACDCANTCADASQVGACQTAGAACGSLSGSQQETCCGIARLACEN